MSAHVHFDVEAIKHQMRGMLAQNIVAARARATTDNDRLYVDLQERFYEIVVTAAACCMEAEMAGAERVMIGQALGGAVGTISAQFMASTRNDPVACLNYTTRFEKTVTTLLAGDQPQDGLTAYMVARPVQGGRA